MNPPTKPTHDLSAIMAKVAVGFVHYRVQAVRSAAELEFSRQDIDQCILELTPADFHKTMPSRVPKWAGCWQDVYKPTYCGGELYVKIQLYPGQRVYVVSFKRKDEDESTE